MMKKFLEKGGKVKKLEPGYPLNVGSLDKSRKPRYTKEEITKGISNSEHLLSKQDDLPVSIKHVLKNM